MSTRRIIDISPTLTPTIGVWPGDSELTREVLCDMRTGDNLTLSTLRATVHLGAHADAPSHYGRDAPSIEQADLERYIGQCQVLEAAVERGQRVSEAMLSAPVSCERVLIRTATFADPEHWNTDFAGLEPALVTALAERGVRLVGVDTPSVDLFESKDLPAHAAFLAHDVAILEGLVLDGVAPGRYELIAPPLKLVGFDASPVRALLRTLE